MDAELRRQQKWGIRGDGRNVFLKGTASEPVLSEVEWMPNFSYGIRKGTASAVPISVANEIGL